MKKFMFIMLAAMSLSFVACTPKQNTTVNDECSTVNVGELLENADSTLVDTVAVDSVISE